MQNYVAFHIWVPVVQKLVADRLYGRASLSQSQEAVGNSRNNLNAMAITHDWKCGGIQFKSDTSDGDTRKNDVVRWCIVSSEMGADLKDSCDCQSNGGGLKRTVSVSQLVVAWTKRTLHQRHRSSAELHTCRSAKFCKPANYATAWPHSVDDTVEPACPSTTATVTDSRSVPWLFCLIDLATCATIRPQLDHGIKTDVWLYYYIYTVPKHVSFTLSLCFD